MKRASANMNAKETVAYTPPLGYAALTPLYDAAIALLTREGVWRSALVAEILAGKHDTIIDIGSGTGSLAVLLHKASPRSIYVGIDPDYDAVERARAKSAKAGASATFVDGYFPQDHEGEPVDVVVSSLVLHQVPLSEKQRIIAAAFTRLKPGGRLILADYGLQDSPLSRLLFRVSVQALDGRENTRPNADGVLPEIMAECGFPLVLERMKLHTSTGAIYIHTAAKPQFMPT